MKTTLLAVYTGSTHPDAEKAYNNIEAKIKIKLPDAEIKRVYTSKRTCEKLAKQGIHVDSVEEALGKLAADKVDHVAVLPCMIFSNNACMEMMADFMIHNEKFKEGISLFRVLLDLAKDYEIFANAFFENLIPAERKSDEAVVLVAHSPNPQLKVLEMVLKQRDSNVFITSMKYPNIKAAGIKKAYLIPLMISAGIHVHRDIAKIKIDSIECVPILKGLGENDRIAEIFASHIL
jgi:sirohydrochlorin cobaltochelatase